MKTYKLMAPCHFGLEAVLKREILDLGYEVTSVEDGRVTFEGDDEAICRANIFLRTAERIMIQAGRFRATTYDELFEGIKVLDWQEYIPENGKFWVTKASSIKSKLFSPSDIQRIAKKAMVECLKEKYKISWFKEDGAEYPVRIFLFKDEAIIGIDTTGESLHKRGYRKLSSKAPISETLAAALIMLTPWKKDRILVDPFCGSGTIPIEAALIAKNRAPGLNRDFAAMSWSIFDRSVWQQARDEARSKEFHGDYNIVGSDIDPKAIEIARENARRAGVDDVVRFEVADATKFDRRTERGVIVTNPPYGERIMEKQQAEDLYRGFGRAWLASENWQLYLLSSHTEFERCFGKQAGKKRKLYNGMIKCDLFMYFK